MESPVRIRPLTREDLGFADALRARVGWNQTLGDWERFLATQPDGCFIAEANGRPVGTATTTIYGPDLAWIGMVLVEPEQRRRGFGRALLQHGLRFLAEQGVTCVKLDATPAGKAVYDTLGFQSEWSLTRWRRPAITIAIRDVQRPAAPATTAAVRGLFPADNSELAGLDREAFGVGRGRVLDRLIGQSDTRIARRSGVEGNAPDLVGFGLRRAGASASYLGPIIARDAQAGRSLLDDLIRGQTGPMVWDIPDTNHAARSTAEEYGFTPERPLIRMFRGENHHPGSPGLIYALAGPEIG